MPAGAHDPTHLPEGLPVPVDDGACDHLAAWPLPPVRLEMTGARGVPAGEVRLDAWAAGPVVVFAYPRTGVPGQPPNRGFGGEDWDAIPGARGCTPQSCGFRDLHGAFAALGVRVAGLSTNTRAHQREASARLELPYPLLSDERLELARALRLPTFEFPVESGGPSTLLRRLAIYAEPDVDGSPRVARTWYPVFPPDRNASDVLAWLRRRAGLAIRERRPGDDAYVRDRLRRHWGSTVVRSRNVPFECDRLPALIGTVDGRAAGMVTYTIDRDSCEVITLHSDLEDRGVGSALLAGAVGRARRAGCARIFLTTSNDNLRALRFYQRLGWRLVRVHPGMIDRYRELDPAIPRTGMHAIPLRDELELELRLDPGAPAGNAT